MRCIIIIVLSCAVGLDAHAFGIGLGLGRRLGSGNRLCLGRIGGIGVGLGGLGFGGRGVVGLGARGMGGSYANGIYGNTGYSGGVSGVGSQSYQNARLGGFHNIGSHHNKVTSINQAEDSGFQNVGSGSAMNNGGYLGNGYNFENGGSQYGNRFGAGRQGNIL